MSIWTITDSCIFVMTWVSVLDTILEIIDLTGLKNEFHSHEDKQPKESNGCFGFNRKLNKQT